MLFSQVVELEISLDNAESWLSKGPDNWGCAVPKIPLFYEET